MDNKVLTLFPSSAPLAHKPAIWAAAFCLHSTLLKQSDALASMPKAVKRSGFNAYTLTLTPPLLGSYASLSPVHEHIMIITIVIVIVITIIT